VQVDVTPALDRTVLDGRQQFLSALAVPLLGNQLREIQVIPTDNGIFDQTPTALSNSLLDFSPYMKLWLGPPWKWVEEENGRFFR